MPDVSAGDGRDKMLRGVFINTATANCSIFESGRMVFECIAHSQDYTLDYFSLEMFDPDHFLRTGSLLLATGEEIPGGRFDFWVFNWHFTTMAVLPPVNLKTLPGRKFCIVLELEPDNPLKLIPFDGFDGYIALDAATPRSGKIFPFPRPLAGEPRTPPPARTEAPVIGSFGFGTPGKGFELLVEAVNREFDRATVRINVPPGTYTTGFTALHGRDYPTHIAEMCRRIAKPGIEVEFTHDFLEPEGVIDWCAQNDLNCFMYTRRQPGLSATTDQAVVSGRPLLTISNDTFRHIHRYVAPYPQVGLREAIETTVPAVHRLQEDWSPATFARTFSAMLASFGLLPGRDEAPPAAVSRPKVLLVVHRGSDGDDIASYSQRVLDAVSRSAHRSVVPVVCRTLATLDDAVARERPDDLLLIDFPAVDKAALARATARIPGRKLVLARDARPTPRGFDIVAWRPVVPFFTLTTYLRPGPPTIWLVGYDEASAALERAVAKVAADLPAAEIFIEVDSLNVWALTPQLENLRKRISLPPSIVLTPAPLPTGGEEMIRHIAAASLIVFRNGAGSGRRIENLASLALITERAVVFSREAPVPAFAAVGVVFESESVPDLIARGISANVKLLAEYGEWRMAAAVEDALEGRRAAVESQPERSGGPSALDQLQALNGAAFLQAAYRLVLGRAADAGECQRLGQDVATGRGRDGVLFDLLSSPEARARDRAVEGSGAFEQRHRRAVAVRRILTQWVLARAVESPSPVVARRQPAGRSYAVDGAPGVSYRDAPHAPARRAVADMLERARKITSGLPARRKLIDTIEPFRPAEPAATPSPAPPAPAVTASAVPPQEPIPPGEPIGTPRVSDGAVFVLVGVEEKRRTQIPAGWVRDLCTALTRQTSRPIRFVTWSHTERALLRTSQPGRAELEDTAGGMADRVVGAGDCADGDWLFVPNRVRTSLDLPDLIESDVILAARRLRLRSAFVFEGADPLRRPQDRGERARAHEQFMQSLLLADAVLPVSDEAADDLKRFMVGRQLATWGPATHVISRRRDTPGPAEWAECVTRLDAVLASLADPGRRASLLYVLVGDGSGPASGLAASLLAALAAQGVRLVPARWDAATQRIVAPFGSAAGRRSWIDPNAPGAPRWILSADREASLQIRDMQAFLKAHDLRIATILGEPGAGDGYAAPPAVDPALFGGVAQADKILIGSRAAYDHVYELLLATRDEAPSVEHRLKCLPLPASSEASNGLAWSDYASALRGELATDRLAEDGERYELPAIDVADLFPNLEKRPKLSLCISTFKRAGWLSQNLRNIFAQMPEERDDFEVLVVDNASPDNTPEVVEPYLHRRDFRYERNEKNVGMLGNLSVTAQRARGEYVLILGDDDLTRRGCIAAILDALHRNPGIGLVYLNYGYTTEKNSLSVKDLDAFLDNYNVLEPACADDLAPVKHLAAKNENFYTAIYSHVYRRDHAIRSYCQDTSGRPFSSMLTCIPTTYYVLNYMPDELAYWIGEPSLVVNSNVSWQAYGTLFDLEQMPRAWALAERNGASASEVDRRRSNRLWLVALMWKEIFEDDRAGNSAYFNPSRVLMRLKHLPRLSEYIGEMRAIYGAARDRGHPAATMAPEVLFRAFG